MEMDLFQVLYMVVGIAIVFYWAHRIRIARKKQKFLAKNPAVKTALNGSKEDIEKLVEEEAKSGPKEQR